MIFVRETLLLTQRRRLRLWLEKRICSVDRALARSLLTAGPMADNQGCAVWTKPTHEELGYRLLSCSQSCRTYEPAAAPMVAKSPQVASKRSWDWHKSCAPSCGLFSRPFSPLGEAAESISPEIQQGQSVTLPTASERELQGRPYQTVAVTLTLVPSHSLNSFKLQWLLFRGGSSE